MTAEVQKVVCYVTHDHHLLVFTHDTVPIEVAGVQVPAGTIAANESPEHAAVRELYEETGRRGRIVRKLGVARYDLRPARDEIAVRHFFHVTLPSGDPANVGKPASPMCPPDTSRSAGRAGGCRSRTPTSSPPDSVHSSVSCPQGSAIDER